MNQVDIIDKDLMNVQVSQAILLYGSKAAYATIHPVTFVDGAAEIGAGVAISKRSLREISRNLVESDAGGTSWADSFFLSERVIAKDQGTIVWYRPPQLTRLWFRSKHVPGDNQGRATCVVHVPGLVFVAKADRSLTVAAVKGSGRPNRSTNVFHAPLMNINYNGAVCVGNVQYPKEINANSIDLFEKAFFESLFTHFNSGLKIDYPTGREQFTADWASGAFPDAFPDHVLHPFKLTLEKFVEKII